MSTKFNNSVTENVPPNSNNVNHETNCIIYNQLINSYASKDYVEPLWVIVNNIKSRQDPVDLFQLNDLNTLNQQLTKMNQDIKDITIKYNNFALEVECALRKREQYKVCFPKDEGTLKKELSKYYEALLTNHQDNINLCEKSINQEIQNTKFFISRYNLFIQK